MNIPKPHSLVTSLVLAALLLAGCSEPQETVPLPTPESTTRSSAETSPTATDTATYIETSAATTDPAQAGASPSQAYSGGPKAPEGEYRVADGYGPAQHVPKPVAPAGMNVESPEAMFLFIDYWSELRNYAYQTGDVADIRHLVDSSFTQEHDFYDAVEELYKSDGWVVGGKITIHYNKDLMTSIGGGEYSIGSNFEMQDSVIVYQGEATYNDNSDSIYDGVDFRLRFQQGAWKVVSTAVVE
ncbi:DUF6318 family protein [Rothia nasimurium]|uniref:DUF6318 family protein n=1 Tax=Rothia nasimurium TaxID=85336 RepID=UPI001F17CB8A|nr:DUF6318 family protein [Rothia nasimurium]